ncbi:MAG: hypothetical protein HY403_01725 [Elusimicrobia bacterium]|nr:hypothetical protein [Elusimicrobiota bacterium]
MLDRLAKAAEILDEFAAATGLIAAEPPRRYLWTDAFAVMTWVGLHERTGERRFLDLAERLIEQVHEILGAPRGGLRIGKPLPERGPDEPYDPDLEWERDGQYYHYLTKWMHALERTAAASRDERYHRSAVELAKTAHRAFAYPRAAPQRLYWKMSVDLSRPLVPSMGAHDPLDGLVAAASLGLVLETRELARICDGHRWATDDALGAGGLLVDALRLARLVARGRQDLQDFFIEVVQDAEASAEAAASTLGGPATRRLAFRELGFALGLHAVEPLGEHADVSRLRPFVPLAGELEDFWLDPVNQAAATWIGHREINAGTLAACLAPDGVLG